MKSFKSNKDGLVLSNKNKKGDYLSVVLRGKNGNKYRRIHQLVAEYFIGEKPQGFQIHHIDENRQNNTVKNLEYVSPKEHYRKTILANPKMLDGMNNYNRNVKPIKILQYDINENLIAEYSNSKIATDTTGICQRNILQVANDNRNRIFEKCNKAGGFIWKFEK